jgi:anti-repressor protein
MEELIQHAYLAIDGKSTLTINARDLHAFLESRAQYGNWIKQQIERGQFKENRDYLVYNINIKNPEGGRPSIEYHITFDMAKHIALMSNTEKGHEVRDYFIRCEERLRELEGTNDIVHSELDMIQGMLNELRRHKEIVKDIPGIRTEIALHEQRIKALEAFKEEEAEKDKRRKWHAEREFSNWQKQWAWNIMDGRCMKCRSRLDPTSPKQAPHHPRYDHIRPKTCGGLGLIDNIQLLCNACNGSKGGCRRGHHNHSDWRPDDVKYEAQQLMREIDKRRKLSQDEMDRQMGFLFDDLTLPDDPLDPRPEDLPDAPLDPRPED